jgi:hypothetical protein
MVVMNKIGLVAVLTFGLLACGCGNQDCCKDSNNSGNNSGGGGDGGGGITYQTWSVPDFMQEIVLYNLGGGTLNSTTLTVSMPSMDSDQLRYIEQQLKDHGFASSAVSTHLTETHSSYTELYADITTNADFFMEAERAIAYSEFDPIFGAPIEHNAKSVRYTQVFDTRSDMVLDFTAYYNRTIQSGMFSQAECFANNMTIWDCVTTKNGTQYHLDMSHDLYDVSVIWTKTVTK